MPEPVAITLIEIDEETDMADGFEDDMSCYFYLFYLFILCFKGVIHLA